MLEIIHHWGKPQQLLFQGPGFSHWISGDYGSTFETVHTPGDTLGFWNQIKTHPRQPDWLAAQVRRRDCLEAGARTNPWCAWDVFVSKVLIFPGLPAPNPRFPFLLSVTQVPHWARCKPARSQTLQAP